MSPNRLINEKSPYLLKHAHNPVDWYPWGDEAFERARREDKPILLSIGYSTCHWCNVMERESFENEEIAELINRNFIPIKVDREERPDVDEIYMRAVQLMTGSGGWPLTVFLTPDLKPFFGGTYFPPKRRGGLPGFDEILKAVAEAWRTKREEIMKSANDVTALIQQIYAHKQTMQNLSLEPVNQAYDALVSLYDSNYGGFGGAPKFPMPTYLFFLHRIYWRNRDKVALRMAQHTLTRMARGGIHDQLAGGFHRYSTDRYWIVPHFEKMLYDNALLARVYLEAYQLTGDNYLRDVAVKTLEWMLRDMKSNEGAFYSAVDADSPEGEGIYYTWKREEVLEILGKEVGEIICKYYGITYEGNFEEKRNILTISRDIDSLAVECKMDVNELTDMINEASMRLLDERNKRPKPAVDDKILTSWNGLAISSLVHGYKVMGVVEYLESAKSAADFILSKLYESNGLLHRYRGGEASINAKLDDYAYLVAGLLDIYESCFEERWIDWAIQLNKEMIERLWDRENGGFYFNQEEVAGISRIKDGYDDVVPSGNSVAAHNLLRLAELTGDTSLEEMAEKTIKVFWNSIEQEPINYTYMLTALDYLLNERREIVLAGPQDELAPFIKEVHKRYLPNTVIAAYDDAKSTDLTRKLALLQGKTSKGRPTAYVCKNFTCHNPVDSLDEFLKLLDE